MKEEWETELTSVKERNKIAMLSLLQEKKKTAVEAASKNENLKTIITEKENQVANLQTAIDYLQSQTNHIYNEIRTFIARR